MMETCECLIIGAGVVGLSVARALALKGREVMVVESHATVAQETSARNSEVIHAGIYYPPNSLKAKLCHLGNSALYEFCDQHHVPYQKLGKLVLAVNAEEISALKKLQENAKRCGVNLHYWDQKVLRRCEPQVVAEAALYSETSGILDSHQYYLALQGDAESQGAQVILNTEVVGGEAGSQGLIFHLQQPSKQVFHLKARCAVNAAGLHAHQWLSHFKGFPKKHILQQRYCKGDYFILQGASPFQHLVYPLPTADGLGVHSTLDVSGQTRFGPNVQWVDTLDYAVAAEQALEFKRAISKYWPEIQNRTLTPGYSGIRPKVVGPGEPAGDFVIQGPSVHGIAGFVNCFGIESPGLTASLPLADWVIQQLEIGL